jgi:hypothetical protein
MVTVSPVGGVAGTVWGQMARKRTRRAKRAVGRIVITIPAHRDNKG